MRRHEEYRKPVEIGSDVLVGGAAVILLAVRRVSGRVGHRGNFTRYLPTGRDLRAAQIIRRLKIQPELWR